MELALSQISLVGYFAMRGVIEGMVFSRHIYKAGEYHAFRLFETFYVILTAFWFSQLNAPVAGWVIAPAFLGLALYEVLLSVFQYHQLLPPEPFMYHIFRFRILVTPKMKFGLIVFYAIMAAVVYTITMWG